MSQLPYMPLGQSPNLFAGAGTPQYVNQFDFTGILGNNATAQLASMAVGSFLGPGMANQGFMAGMFSPNMNFYDVQRSMAYHNGMLSQMAAAQQADTANLVNLARGIAGGLTPGQEAAVTTFANDVGTFMPFIAQMAPGLVDTLYGSRGSAVLMAQELYAGSRLRAGVSPNQAGALATVMSQEFFGPTADISGWKGMSQHRVGSLYNVLATQQMLGTVNMGAIAPSQQLEHLAGMSNAGSAFGLAADFQQLATGSESQKRRYADIVARSGINVSGMSVEQQSQALAASDTASKDILRDIQQFDSSRYEQIVNQFDAKQVASRLKNLAGAVSAMRDIFGDAGRPNAPMNELINGLNQLTQGGLASMQPAELERSVRLTQALAQNTGIGIQGMQQLVAVGAATADQLGIDRGFALAAAQGSAAFGAAYGAMGRPEFAAYGRLDAEKYTMMDQQLRLRGANSPVANRMNLVLRMQQEIGFQDGSQAEAMAEAIRAGKETYMFGGKEQSVFLSGPQADAQLTQMLQGQGISASAISGMLNDTYTNQQYGLQANTGDLARRAMMKIDIAPRIAQQFGTAAMSAISGLGLSAEKTKQLRDAIGSAASSALQDMTPEQYTNATERNKALSTAIRAALRTGGVDESQVSEQAVAAIAAGGWGNWESAIRTNPALRHLESGVASLDLMNRDVIDYQGTVIGQAQHDAKMRSAFAGLGTSNVAKRISNFLQRAGQSPDGPQDIRAFVNEVLGGVPDAKVAERLTTAMTGASVLLDESNRLTKERSAKAAQVTEKKLALKRAQESAETDPAVKARQIQQAKDDLEKAKQEFASVETELGGITGELSALMSSDKPTMDNRIKQLEKERAELVTAGQSTETIDKRIAALRTGGVASAAEEAGVLTKVTVSAENSLEAAAALRSGRKGAFDKQRALLDNFSNNEQNILQLGAGGMELLDKARSTSDAIQALANKKGMTVDELMASNDPELAPLLKEQTATMEALAARQKAGGPVSDEEKKRIQERIERAKNPSKYAEEVVSSLEKQLGSSLTAEEREQLVKNVASGGVGFVDRVQRAAAAREKLSGMKGDHASVGDFVTRLRQFKSQEEADTAGMGEAYRLAQEAGDIGLLGAASAGSSALGNSGSAINEAVGGLKEAEKAKQAKQEMVVTGKVTLVDKREAEVAFRGSTRGNTPALGGLA